MGGINLNSTKFANVFLARVKMGALKQSLGIHSSITIKGNLSDVVFATILVPIFAIYGSMDVVR